MEMQWLEEASTLAYSTPNYMQRHVCL